VGEEMSDSSYIIVDFEDATGEYLVEWSGGGRTGTVFVPVTFDQDGRINTSETLEAVSNAAALAVKEANMPRPTVSDARNLVGSSGMAKADLTIKYEDGESFNASFAGANNLPDQTTEEL